MRSSTHTPPSVTVSVLYAGPIAYSGSLILPVGDGSGKVVLIDADREGERPGVPRLVDEVRPSPLVVVELGEGDARCCRYGMRGNVEVGRDGGVEHHEPLALRLERQRPCPLALVAEPVPIAVRPGSSPARTSRVTGDIHVMSSDLTTGLSQLAGTRCTKSASSLHSHRQVGRRLTTPGFGASGNRS